MKALWVVGASEESVPGIKRSHEMGLHVIVSDQNPEAPGMKLADEAVVVSTHDVEATVRCVWQYQNRNDDVDGVLSFAADVPRTVARVAKNFGLTGISEVTAEICSNKYRLRQHLKEHGIIQPNYRLAHGALYEATHVQVFKPVDNCGGRGVMRVDVGGDTLTAFTAATEQSESRQVICEDWLDGPQVSTETVILEGKCYTVGFIDRNYNGIERYYPHIIENGGQQPTILHSAWKVLIIEAVEKAILTLGIENGTVKGDMVLHKAMPIVIELAPRLSGGYMSSTQIPLATGIDLLSIAIRLALGEKVNPEELKPTKNVAVAIRYVMPEKVTCHPERGQHYIATGRTREEAVGLTEQMVKESCPI